MISPTEFGTYVFFWFNNGDALLLCPWSGSTHGPIHGPIMGIQGKQVVVHRVPSHLCCLVLMLMH